MNDKALARFVDRLPAKPSPPAQPVDDQGEEDHGAFGLLRGARERALMLEFRLRDGSVVAFSYAMLDRAAFDPSTGISLRFAGQEVQISGQALGMRGATGVTLFEGILRHRVAWIKESGRADRMEARPGAVVVESITLI